MDHQMPRDSLWQGFDLVNGADLGETFFEGLECTVANEIVLGDSTLKILLTDRSEGLYERRVAIEESQGVSLVK